MSPNKIFQHVCTIQFVSVKIFLQAKIIQKIKDKRREDVTGKGFFSPFSSPMPKFVWVMGSRYESRGQIRV